MSVLVDRRDALLIGGRWEMPATEEQLTVISPSTEEAVAVVPCGADADMDRAVAAARRAFDDGPWRWMSPEERGEYIRAIASNLKPMVEDLAQTMTAETGVAISSTKGKGPASIAMLEFQADLAGDLEIERQSAGVIGSNVVVQEPVGVVAAIIPWNSPIYLAVSKLAPALLAGCTVVMKPAPETPLSSYLLADAIEAAGLPDGVVSIIAADRDVGAYLVAHPGVDKVAFTGSTAAGSKIMGSCATAMRRVSLELGGKSAAIVLDDADIEQTVAQLVPGALTNSGQTCAALTRVLVSEARHDELVDGLCATFGALTIGDPFDPATQIGPLIAARQRARVEEYLAIGRSEGARVVLGGGRPPGRDRGWYVEPTIFVDVDNGMRIAREEIFGPVVCIIPYRDEADAIAIANDSEYGLGGAVFTADMAHGYRVARQIRTGFVTVNGFAIDWTVPFGGFKRSGLGREGGREAVQGYLEPKTISFPSGYGSPEASGTSS